MPEPTTTTGSIIATAVASGHGAEVSKVMIFLAGLLGGVLSLRFVEGISRWQRVTSVLFSAVLAHYTAPFLAHLFDIFAYAETIGFLIGLFGLSACGVVFKALSKSDLWELILRRFGGKPPGNPE